MTNETAGGNDLRTLNNGVRQHNPALRGASLAFGQPAVKPKPIVNTYSGNNGALAAATKAGMNSRAQSAAVSRQNTGSQAGVQAVSAHNTGRTDTSYFSPSHAEPPTLKQRLNQLGRAESTHLKLPESPAEQLSRSPSHIAASLAASRSASPASASKPKTSPLPSSRLPSSSQQTAALRRNNTAMSDETDRPDTSSIPPTSSLIGRFEQSAHSPNSNRRKTPSPVKTVKAVKAPPPVVRSPKPVRAKPLQAKALETSPRRPPTPKAKPIAIANPQTQRRSRPTTADGAGSSSSLDSYVSASDHQSPVGRTPAPLPPRPRNVRSRSSHTPVGRKPISYQDAMTIDSMANAIVASSLASSRAGSPGKQNDRPQPPPRRQSKSTSIFHHHHHLHPPHGSSDRTKRTPSPVRSMRQTLRTNKSSDGDGSGERDANMERVKKKNVLGHMVGKKHPNKHHEGDRKRWRDTITDRERKRYEAVWASNKGILTESLTAPEARNLLEAPLPLQVARHFSGSSAISTTKALHQVAMADVVLNLVVKDIWSRSRLGADDLGEAWDLVDRNGKGFLEKEEFVVGLWLLDQRLKGRKLPIRVSDSVWGSVGLGGLKIRGGSKHKGKKHH